MMRLIITIALLLSSCSLIEEIQPYRIDAEFLPYVESFRQDADLRGIDVNVSSNIVIEFGDFGENISPRGISKKRRPGLSKIVINPNFWDNSTHLYRKKTIYHELGHSILDREHDNSTDERGYCLSIMSNTCGGLAWSVPWKEDSVGIVDELFGFNSVN